MAQVSCPETDRERFRELPHQHAREVIEASADALFTLSSVEEQLPTKAKIQPSQNCARCGEPTMPAKMETVAGERLCKGCWEG